MGNVTKFYAHGAANDPDNVLDQAKGQYENLLIIGWDREGNMDARADLGLKSNRDVLWLVETFKAMLMDGTYNLDE